MQQATRLVTAPEPSGPKDDARRLQRGAVIALLSRINEIRKGIYQVPSQAQRNGEVPFYYVDLNGGRPTCTCPDFELRNRPCKHIHAVQFLLLGEEFRPLGEEFWPGEPGEIGEVELKPKKKTYKQDWRTYDAAQVHELEHFEVLLRQLCDLVEEPDRRFGRPRLPVNDMLFAAALKVYHDKSRRRVMGTVERACQQGLLGRAPSHSSLTRFLNDEDLVAPLKYLVEQSALPLRALEDTFAIDSTGFTTVVYERWFDKKWGRVKSQATYVKLHLTCGVKTKTIAAVDVSDSDANDSPFLLPQLRTTAENFTVRELSADKAYLSKGNFNGADALNVDLFVPFKINSRAQHPKRKRSKAWERAFHFFHYNRDEFLAHYHQRSIAESVVNMVKSKFGPALWSRSETAQKNELLLKALGHNITVLIHEAYKLGVESELEKWLSDPATAPQGGAAVDDRTLAVAP